MRPIVASLLRFSFVACLLLAAGCDDSKDPLSSPAKSSPDKQLIGVWQHKDDGSTTYYLVGYLGAQAPESVMRLVTVTHEKNGELQEPHQALLFPAVIDGSSYLNVAAAKEEQLAQIEEKGWQPDLLNSYFILKYRFEDGALLAWPMNSEAKNRAIEAGKIKGETKSDGRPAKFTDTTQNLAKFVAAAGGDLFSAEPLRFERVR